MAFRLRDVPPFDYVLPLPRVRVIRVPESSSEMPIPLGETLLRTPGINANRSSYSTREQRLDERTVTIERKHRPDRVESALTTLSPSRVQRASASNEAGLIRLAGHR